VHKQKQVLALAADQLSRDVGEILVPPLASLTPPHPRLAPTNYEPLMVPGTSALAYCEPLPPHHRPTTPTHHGHQKVWWRFQAMQLHILSQPYTPRATLYTVHGSNLPPA
jgi:hypothetical protein